MTPVQLPEVPAPVSGTNALIGGYTVWVAPASNYYTAAQLREYATEAVRLNIRPFLPACEALKREGIREQSGGMARGDPGKIANADRLIALIESQSETNSER